MGEGGVPGDADNVRRVSSYRVRCWRQEVQNCKTNDSTQVHIVNHKNETFYNKGDVRVQQQISRTFRSLLGRSGVLRKLGDFLFEEMLVAFATISTKHDTS